MIAPDIENETQLIDHSKYYDDNSFSDVLKNSNNKLSMISLNCRSINAKFDKLKLFVTEMNTHETISVICIQETWGHNGIDMDVFSLCNYTLVNENMIATKNKVYLLQIEIVIGLFKYIFFKLLRMYYTINKNVRSKI